MSIDLYVTFAASVTLLVPLATYKVWKVLSEKKSVIVDITRNMGDTCLMKWRSNAHRVL